MQSALQTIGDYAFENCTSLTEITIPSEVTTIEGNAFGGCMNLQTVIFAEGSKLQTIGDNAFENCTSLTEITIPSEVTTIEGNAFGGCMNLQTVIFAEGSKLQTIGDNAFENCTSLTEITIPSEVTTIREDLFRGCENLQTIILPTGLKEIGYGFEYLNAFVFYLGDSQSWSQIDGGNYFVLNVYFYSESQPEDDGNYWRYVNGKPVAWSWGDIKTFRFITNNGTQLSEITGYVLYELPVPVSTGKIFAGWYDNASLSGSPVSTPYYNSEKTTLYAAWVEQGQQSEGLEIKNGVIVGIGTCKDTVLQIAMPVADRAFSNCSQITEVYFYDGCTRLGNNAFERCQKLEKVYFYQSFVPQIGADLFSSTWDDSEFRVYVPADLITQYQNVKDTYWQNSIITAGKIETFENNL